jgi:hypothetical protein
MFIYLILSSELFWASSITAILLLITSFPISSAGLEQHQHQHLFGQRGSATKTAQLRTIWGHNRTPTWTICTLSRVWSNTNKYLFGQRGSATKSTAQLRTIWGHNRRGFALPPGHYVLKLFRAAQLNKNTPREIRTVYLTWPCHFVCSEIMLTIQFSSNN